MDARNISVVMPYYDRYEVTEETLHSYKEFYGDDVQVIIVDDGSPRKPALGLKQKNVEVITLPEKFVGYSPVIPINVGIEYASHDLLVISLPEVKHESAALYNMREVYTPFSYVMARCKCRTMNRWLAHPTEAKQHDKPEGIAFNFCVMFDRTLWKSVGGMSREYRWGSHFDDTDFAHKIIASGAELKWVDDVVVHSREHGAKAPWVKGGWHLNELIFKKRWRR